MSGLRGTKSGRIVGIPEQAAACLDNLSTVLDGSGSTLDHLVKIHFYVTDLSETRLAQINTVCARFFDGRSFPSRTVVGVSKLIDGADIELEAVVRMPVV